MAEAQTSWGLYLHIPFCERKCPYCDFNTYAGLEDMHARFARALATEVRREGERRGRPHVRTVFLGGGTPTVLAPDLLGLILDAVRSGFDLAPDAEITSEANPGTVDQAKFGALRDLGVNRLSLGAQSFVEEELRFLGRIHSVADIYQAVESARTAGFNNINLDLIYGLPEQPLEHWEYSLRHALALAPEHISCYALTVEEGTPLARWVTEGRVPAPDDDLQAEMYLRGRAILAAAGYEHYEISNWARPGRACQHNLIYWRNEVYLGFGPGAHSYDGHRRWWTVRSPREYIQRVEAGISTEAGGEVIPRHVAMSETMMLGLRLLKEGVNRTAFRQRFGVDILDVYKGPVARLQALQLLEVNPVHVRLTPRAYAIANQVMVEFILPSEGPPKEEDMVQANLMAPRD